MLKNENSRKENARETSSSQDVHPAPFQHRSLQERAEAYGGKLLVSGEDDWGEPVGSEEW